VHCSVLTLFNTGLLIEAGCWEVGSRQEWYVLLMRDVSLFVHCCQSVCNKPESVGTQLNNELYLVRGREWAEVSDRKRMRGEDVK
jgi:hypothetical protein